MINEKADVKSRDEKIILYLLNQIMEKESEEFEDEYFADQSLFDRIQEVETDLIEAYSKYKLLGHTFNWTQAFEKHYLANPERRKRVDQEIASLEVSLEFLHKQGLVTKRSETNIETANAATQASDAETSLSGSEGASEKLQWWEVLFPFLRGGLIPVLATAVAVLLLVSIGLLILSLRLRNQNEAHQVEQARRAAEREQRVQELQQQIDAQLGDAEKLKAELEEAKKELEKARAATPVPGTSSSRPEVNQVAYLNLSPGLKGTDRNVGTGNGNIIEARAETSVAQISALIDTDEYQRFNAIVKSVSGDNVVWKATLEAKKRGRNLLVTASIPMKNFPVEFKDYMLVLNGVKPDGSNEEYDKYSFKVERK